MNGRLVDLATIAEAVGVEYRTVAEKWATSPAWPPHHDRAGLGGAKCWRVEDLPTAFVRRGKTIDVRRAVELLLARRDAERLYGGNPMSELPAAPTGDLIQPADAPTQAIPAPAATGAGGVARGGDVVAVDDLPDHVLVGHLAGSSPREDVIERVQRARILMAALQPLLALPERARNRRAVAESIARDLKCSFQHVYKLAHKAREGGLMALARMGERRDRGQARTLISGAWMAWAQTIVEAVPGQDVPQLADMTRQAARSAWVGGAPSASQCWRMATAAIARQLLDAGVPSHLVTGLLSVKAPRKWLEEEGKHFRVAGKALRDGKAVYDGHIAPVKRTAAGLKPGDLVCGDITPLDIPVLRDDGSVAYARMVSWHDVASNWLWCDLILLDKGQGIRRDDVAASFARMCEAAPFGMPRQLYLDNGSEYRWDEMLIALKHLADLTGHQFTADEAATAAPQRQVIRSIPFHPRGKRVEGQFGNLADWLAWWFGYVGGNRMTKKVVTMGKGVKPSRFEEVQEWLNRLLADYHVTPQPRAEHMGGMSPKDRLEHFMQSGWRPWKIDRFVLALAFADRYERKVTRGTVSVGGKTYFADFLMHIDGRVTVAHPRVIDAPVDCVYIIDKGRVLGVAAEEQVYRITDPAGAKEAGRRRQAFRVLTGEKIEQAGGVMDAAKLTGTHAKLLGLQATLDKAGGAAQYVDLTPEMAELQRGYLAAQERAIEELNRRAEARKSAEQLTRWADEDEDTKAARAMGF
jgi:hypothetical protein